MSEIKTWKSSLRGCFFTILTLMLLIALPWQAASQQVNGPVQSPVINQSEPREHSPSRAAMLSAVLPGMGQAYNGRIWKVPIIYAGFGAVVYFVNFNNTEYQHWRNAYFAKIDENPNTIDLYPNIPPHNLERAMNYYRRNLEISYISGAALYLLNILDASVDAHLLDFDVGEDLTMRLQPHVTPVMSPGAAAASAPGIRLTLRF